MLGQRILYLLLLATLSQATAFAEDEQRIPSLDGTRNLVQAQGEAARTYIDERIAIDPDLRQAVADLTERGYTPGPVYVTYTERTGWGIPTDGWEGEAVFWPWGKEGGVAGITLGRKFSDETTMLAVFETDGREVLWRRTTRERLSLGKETNVLDWSSNPILHGPIPEEEEPSKSDYKNGEVLPPAGANAESDFYACAFTVVITAAAGSALLGPAAPAAFYTAANFGVAGCLFASLFW